jgi:hypothetical protein
VVIPVLVAAAPPFVPWPAVFGLLATLQNVATIYHMDLQLDAEADLEDI